MKKYIILVIVVIILFIPIVKETRCFGAVGPENPTGSQCSTSRSSIIKWIVRNA